MKSCACCASAAPDDAPSCAHCGEGSWIAAPRPAAMPPSEDAPPAEEADDGDDADDPAAPAAPDAAPWARSARKRAKRNAPN